MRFVLILWLASNGAPDATAKTNGALAMETFDSHDACYFALSHVLEKAQYVTGICVPKGGAPLRDSKAREFRELERASDEAARRARH